MPGGTRGAVVTGAGRGIGRALAGKLAAEGYRVVVNDLDEPAVRDVAEQIGGVPAAGDCASTDGVRALLATARASLQRIDAYFANAGIDAGAGLDTPDDVWARVLDVNLLAHVRAARELVPAWLADGRGGRFVVTASAAGLLTMLGNAPYATTKHGAVAFAEWLSATYRDAGIVVQVICPQGVRTRMLENVGPLRPLLDDSSALTPEEVTDAVWEGMEDDRFLILPHGEVREFYRRRATDTDGWLRGMNRLQQRLAVPR
jgi:NAD(P)-dependent dehydrogenase (short-subunit alcohol dehydrogenase family)